LRVSKCEHMKRISDFAQMDISVKADWVDHFRGFARETSM
jgi:hypothetical protein